MTVPGRLLPRVKSVLVPLILVPTLNAAEPSGPVRDDVQAPEPYVFSADPLSHSAGGGPRLLPSGFTAPGGAATTNWALLIDQTWGPSPLTTPEMLQIFDTFWSQVDSYFACFQGLTVDWAALRTSFRAEVESGGVSRGRFAAIMNHLALALRESHSSVRDEGVNSSALAPGVPLFVVGGWGQSQHFGACLTPLPDGRLLVYKATPNHVLGLVPGDIVLGYGGVPWNQLYPELLAAQLPLTGWWDGSSDSSWTHSMQMSAGLNWHLFGTDTIDVVKKATGETVHLPVAPLASAPQIGLDCSEQLPVPGVPMPDYLGSSNRVTWGLVDGTQIGYVYVRAWINDAGDRFLEAVSSLLNNYQTTGLIFDFRTNYGGNMFLAYPALSLLFSGDVSTIGAVQRCNATDHFAMCPSPSNPSSNFVIHGTAAVNYNRPIAVLVGPGAVSSGDQVAHLFNFHPNARFFGKSTATAFNSPYPVPLLEGWTAQYAWADTYRLTDPTNYLTHDEFPVDYPVWFTPDDVALGKDTVVEAAQQWIVGPHVYPVPDGSFGSAMRASRRNATGTQIDLTWDVTTCSSLDHHVLFGTLATVSSLTVAGSACNLGSSGTAIWSGVPSTSIWFTIVGDNDATTEGSWGTNSAGAQRRGTTVSGRCGMTTRNNSSTCP